MRTIVSRQCHYVLKVKANHKRLFAQMQQVCSQLPRQSHTNITCQKGRKEVRKIDVFRAEGEEKGKWCGLHTFLKVTRLGVRQGQSYERVSYYISDLNLQAEAFLAGIRLHWSIENGLHWTKDAVFKEDKCRTRIANGAATLSLLRSFAISLLARTGNGISRAMRRVTNKPEKIAQLLE